MLLSSKQTVSIVGIGNIGRMKKRLAVFASGRGSNFEAIVSACESGRIAAQVVLLVCDHPSAEVVARAKAHHIDCFAFSPKDYASKADYEQAISLLLEQSGVELICLAGYMRLLSEAFVNRYLGRIINIHPSLLPAFKGAHAIEQAFEYGVKIYGVTIHYVDATMDGGKIISQQAVPYEGQDIAELEAMLHALEHELYINTINKLIAEQKI